MRVVRRIGRCVRRGLALGTGLVTLAACGGGGGNEPGEVPADFQGTVFYQIAAGDLNEDERTDLAAIAVRYDGRSGTPDPAELQVLVQDPARPGRFAVRAQLALSTALGAVAIGDLDGDAREDIVVTEPASRRVLAFLQDAIEAGRFVLAGTSPTGAAVGAIEIADVDLDAVPDLVLVTATGVETLRQDPAAPGTFPLRIVVDDSRDPDRALESDQDSLAVGDLDQNDLADLATVRKEPDARIHFHEPAVPGTFASAVRLGLSLPAPDAIAAADLNRDAANDVVAVGNDGEISPQVILRIRLQDPDRPGEFGEVWQGTLDDRGEPRQVVVADVTDDGWPDLVVPKLFVIDHGFIEVLAQTRPAFGFQRLAILTPLTLAGLDPYLRGFAVGDLNADGLPDLAVTDGELSAFFNDLDTPGTFAPARRVLD